MCKAFCWGNKTVWISSDHSEISFFHWGISYLRFTTWEKMLLSQRSCTTVSISKSSVVQFHKLFPTDYVLLAFMGYSWDEKENVLLQGLFHLKEKIHCVRGSHCEEGKILCFLFPYTFCSMTVWSENTLAGFGAWSKFNQEVPESHSLLFSLNIPWEIEQCWEEGWWEMLSCSSPPSSLQSRVVIPGEWTVALKLGFSCLNTCI